VCVEVEKQWRHDDDTKVFCSTRFLGPGTVKKNGKLCTEFCERLASCWHALRVSRYLFSILNIVTDAVYVYDEVPLFSKVKKGHQIAAIVICSVTVLYWIPKRKT